MVKMSLLISVTSSYFDSLNDTYKVSIKSDISKVYNFSFQKAKEEFHLSNKISKENTVSEWYKGTTDDGYDYEVYVLIKERESSMGPGFGIWITDFHWL
jgi:hypothetical protein